MIMILFGCGNKLTNFFVYSSPNAEEMDSGIHSHTAPPFLMSSAESKLFSSPGSFNFSMAALTDPASLGKSTHYLSSSISRVN